MMTMKGNSSQFRLSVREGVLSCSAAFEQRLISSKRFFITMFAAPTSIHASVAYWPSLLRSQQQKQGEKYMFSPSV